MYIFITHLFTEYVILK
ncbi:TPA: stress response small protein YobI, partial [Shigella sonnei]|nr:stress response small protein YobI [Shigella sonnei]HDX6600685.1 stress response small protein YobI [Escherichia coli]